MCPGRHGYDHAQGGNYHILAHRYDTNCRWPGQAGWIFPSYWRSDTRWQGMADRVEPRPWTRSSGAWRYRCGCNCLLRASDMSDSYLEQFRQPLQPARRLDAAIRKAMQHGPTSVRGTARVGEYGELYSDFGPIVRYISEAVQSINQSINTFITRHGTEARATVRIMPKQREMS